MRYILALKPPKEDAFIHAAQRAFSSITDGYLLTDGASLPHISIVQFQCAEPVLAQIGESIQKMTATCPVTLLGLLLKKGETPPNHYSVSLSVKRSPPLMELHNKALHLLETHTLAPINPSGDLYQPHITLAGIRWPASENIALPSILDDLIGTPHDPFHLTLGLGDAIGQYIETLITFD